MVDPGWTVVAQHGSDRSSINWRQFRVIGDTASVLEVLRLVRLAEETHSHLMSERLEP